MKPCFCGNVSMPVCSGSRSYRIFVFEGTNCFSFKKYSSLEAMNFRNVSAGMFLVFVFCQLHTYLKFINNGGYQAQIWSRNQNNHPHLHHHQPLDRSLEIPGFAFLFLAN